VHGIWGLGFLALLSTATVAALRRFLPYWRTRQSHKQEDSSEQRHEAIRQGGRLMIMIGAGLTLLAFICYPQAAAVTPYTSARYLIGLLIAFPAVLAPLWEKQYSLKELRVWGTRLKAAIR